ncbi:dimethylamine monooxygenase subunit DmmA family protein [Hyphomicrobium sp.]|uniref:dimethylamine monooxygenase subunit DmmA family protein n=1 Tax=Hyphomicrobium sp. TaxID=82 RepID=UPI003F6E65CC
MLVDGIKSRPQYPGLTADQYANHHVFVADGDGAAAIIDLFARQGPEIKGRVTLVYADTSADGSGYTARLKELPVEIVHVLPTIATAINRLSGVLNAARMGTRIYASGTETLIGLAVQLAQELGMDPRAIMTEHRGTRARRVQCVHCKGFSENVTTNIVKCAHCGENLLVRDHYSRRLAAFQGVCVDAEVRGELPDIEEVFK